MSEKMFKCDGYCGTTKETLPHTWYILSRPNPSVSPLFFCDSDCLSHFLREQREAIIKETNLQILELKQFTQTHYWNGAKWEPGKPETNPCN